MKRFLVFIVATLSVLSVSVAAINAHHRYANVEMKKAKNGHTLFVKDERITVGFYAALDYWNRAAGWHMFAPTAGDNWDIVIRESNGACGGHSACAAPPGLKRPANGKCTIYINRNKNFAAHWSVVAHEAGHCLGFAHHPQHDTSYRGVMLTVAPKDPVMEHDTAALKAAGYPVANSVSSQQNDYSDVAATTPTSTTTTTQPSPAEQSPVETARVDTAAPVTQDMPTTTTTVLNSVTKTEQSRPSEGSRISGIFVVLAAIAIVLFAVVSVLARIVYSLCERR